MGTPIGEKTTMKTMTSRTMLAVAGIAVLAGCATVEPGPQNMTFFITSAGPGKGGNLGGLEGADRHCQSLAQAVGAGGRTWRAYLSTQAPKLADPGFVNARDRIGTGPWHNVQGVLIARSVDDLHSANSNLNKLTALDEKGKMVQRSHREAQHARHHHRFAPRRYRLSRCAVSRHDVRQLDQRRRQRRGHDWPS